MVRVDEAQHDHGVDDHDPPEHVDGRTPPPRRQLQHKVKVSTRSRSAQRQGYFQGQCWCKVKVNTRSRSAQGQGRHKVKVGTRSRSTQGQGYYKVIIKRSSHFKVNLITMSRLLQGQCLQDQGQDMITANNNDAFWPR